MTSDDLKQLQSVFDLCAAYGYTVQKIKLPIRSEWANGHALELDLTSSPPEASSTGEAIDKTNPPGESLGSRARRSLGI